MMRRYTSVITTNRNRHLGKLGAVSDKLPARPRLAQQATTGSNDKLPAVGLFPREL